MNVAEAEFESYMSRLERAGAAYSEFKDTLRTADIFGMEKAIACKDELKRIADNFNIHNPMDISAMSIGIRAGVTGLDALDKGFEIRYTLKERFANRQA